MDQVLVPPSARFGRPLPTSVLTCSPEEELKVLSLDVTGLRSAMAIGELSSALITSVYIRRGRILGEKLNSVTEEMAESAMMAAEAADARWAAYRDGEGKVRQLEGIPISIKDCFICAGTCATVGLKNRVGIIDAEDGLFVKVLRDFGGAIPIFKTNVPPMMMSIESDNNVFGPTSNPHNLSRCVGGSSGGEGASLAANCAPLGFGTDIGGSIRVQQ